MEVLDQEVKLTTPGDKQPAKESHETDRVEAGGNTAEEPEKA